MAAADTCTGTVAPSGPEAGQPDSVTRGSGRPFAACFDPGNRLSVVADTTQIEASIQVRHIIHFADEPDLVWKMEHTFLDTSHADTEASLSTLLYRGIYIRHSRDGHIILPFGDPPAKVFCRSTSARSSRSAVSATGRT